MDFKQATEKYPGYKSVLDFIKWKQLPKDSDLTPYEYLVRVWKQRPLAPGTKPSEAELEKYARLYWDEKILDRDSLEIQKDWVDYVNGKRDASRPYHDYVGAPAGAEGADAATIEDSVAQIEELNKELEEKLQVAAPEGTSDSDDSSDDDSGSAAGTSGIMDYLGSFASKHSKSIAIIKKAAELNPTYKAGNLALQKALSLAKSAPTISALGAAGTLERGAHGAALASGEFSRWPPALKRYTWFVYNCDQNQKAQRQFARKWDDADEEVRLATLKHLQQEFKDIEGRNFYKGAGRDEAVIGRLLKQSIEALEENKDDE